MGNKQKNIPVHHPKTFGDFQKLNNDLRKRGFIAIDALRPGFVRDITIADTDPSEKGAADMATSMSCGAWSTGPLAKVAWSFDDHGNSVTEVKGPDGKPLGLGYVKWGPGNATPSVIPPLAMSLPYTASPLRYLADLITGLGVHLMYRFPDGELCEYKDAGARLRKMMDEESAPEDNDEDLWDESLYLSASGNGKPRKLSPAEKAYKEWARSWYGYDDSDSDDTPIHVPGAKEFMEENNLDFHLSQCMQDHVMLDIFFPTVGLQRGRRGQWKPKVVQVSMLPASSTRLSKMNEYRHINAVYFSDSFRKNGIGTRIADTDPEQQKIVMYPACMPQQLISDLRYIVESNQRTRIKDRPTWICCPTLYPSLNKPYYPQPAWWSIFTSKAFDFASTILYDKYKQRENNTTWGRIIYISLDYLDMMFADEGIAGDKDKQLEYINELDQSVETFLQRRENTGKMMRQFMWLGQDGKEHHNVEIVDVADTVKDNVSAGKEELGLSTSPIFLALGVDPRLVGVPMVAASNGGTALREMQLLKQQQLSIHQKLYCQFLNTAVCTWNGWANAEFHIKQQTLTTLDNSKTGTVETISGEEA